MVIAVAGGELLLDLLKTVSEKRGPDAKSIKKAHTKSHANTTSFSHLGLHLVQASHSSCDI